ncbi:hypothetical protein M3Y99_00902700 [Aphelenchoides fujianensis]|nr:hypothetical protein M3Y99_00902700 [Aphelenchoides fujianensis]
MTGTDRLLNGLAAVFNDGIHSDFVVQVGSVEFKVLKLIVGIHSEVFQRMFATNMREAEENRVEIKDFSPQAIECLLRYCYTGTLQELSSSMLVEVFRAAHCYQMAELVAACKRQAIVMMRVENVLEWLTVGFDYEDEGLKQTFLHFFFQHDEEIQAMPEFELFFEQHPSIAAELFRRMAAERKSLKADVQKLEDAKRSWDRARNVLARARQRRTAAQRANVNAPFPPFLLGAPILPANQDPFMEDPFAD